MGGISALIKGTPQRFLTPSREEPREMAVCDLDEGLPQSQLAWYPHLGLPASRTVKYK